MVHTTAATLKTDQDFAHSHSQNPVRFPAGQNERFNPASPSFYPPAVTAGIRYYTLQAKPCAKERPLWKPMFCLEAGTARKSTAAPNSFKIQAGDIGQSTQGAGLCRLLAYMSASRQPFIFQSRNIYGSQSDRRGADNEKQTLALRRPDRRSRERIQIFDETDGGRLEDRLRSDAS